MQGALQQVGDLGGAVWSLAIAYYTFSFLFLLKKPSIWATRIILGVGWTTILVLPIVGPHAIQDVDKSGYFYGVVGAWCWIGSGYRLLWFLYLYMWIFLALASSVVIYGLVYLRLSGRLSIENGKLVWKASGQSQGLNCLDSSWVAHDIPLSFHASESGSNGGRTPAEPSRLLDYTYSIVTIPVAIMRLGATAGWQAPFPYLVFAGATFSSSGLANVLLFIATRHSFIRQAATVRPRVHVTTQQITVLEDSRGAQKIHLHEFLATRPEEQDGASEKVDLERDGSFKLKQREHDVERDVGTPAMGVRFLTKE
ncbi:hypothetical protein FRC06_002526 [Ceratobasidium sp. 370]|nr:hypothetical protein FRC06_002526 [Ceratobasidium sp. 370]